MKPIVSIILPTYNGKAKRLSKSIDSVLNQTFKDFELIIINDASTNDIEKTIFEYMNRDKRIVYLKNDNNLKLVKTLNKGIKNSKGKYIARIDDDDIRADNDKLQKQINFLESHEDYGICGAVNVVAIDENGESIERFINRESDNDIRNHLLQSNQFAHSSIMIRKECLDKVGCYDPKYNIVEDYELWSRIGEYYKFSNLKNITLLYRTNTSGISHNNYKKQQKLAFKVFRKNRHIYPHFLRALILRVGDFLLPKKVRDSILGYVKSLKRKSN